MPTGTTLHLCIQSPRTRRPLSCPTSTTPTTTPSPWTVTTGQQMHRSSRTCRQLPVPELGHCLLISLSFSCYLSVLPSFTPLLFMGWIDRVGTNEERAGLSSLVSVSFSSHAVRPSQWKTRQTAEDGEKPPFFPIFISSPFPVSLLYPPVFPLFRGQTHICKKPLLCCCSSDLPANHHPTLSRIITFYTTNEFSFFFITTVSGPGVKCSCLCPAWPVPKRNKPICVHTTSPDTIVYVPQSLTWLRGAWPN